MIYNGKYYSALNDGHVCTDGNWYPNDTCYRDYYTDEWVSYKQGDVVWLEDVEEYADRLSDKFEAYMCTECGKYYASDDNIIVTKDSGEVFCKECADGVCYQCIDCDDWFSNINNAITDCDFTTLCQDCAENYHECSCCGCFVHNNDVEFNYMQEPLCPICYREYMSYCPIKPYHSYIDYSNLITEGQKEIPYNDLKLFGFEIEVECDKDLAERTLELLNGYAELQEDSSVNGFEIITMPMTKEFFYETFVNNLKNALDYLKDNGALAHNKGGIHIHFSYNNISKTLNSSNLFNLIHCNTEAVETQNKCEIIRQLAQRKKSDLLRWASPYGTDRYSAVRYDSRTETYEMRIFNSNLRIERVIKNFEVLLSMIEYSETFGKDRMKMDYYLKWILQTKDKYECLKCFIKEKQIDRLINKIDDNWLSIFSREREVELCA